MAHDVASLEIQVPVPVAQASDHVYLVSLVDPFPLRGLAPGPQLEMQILHMSTIYSSKITITIVTGIKIK
jgi:hypothetical protein